MLSCVFFNLTAEDNSTDKTKIFPGIFSLSMNAGGGIDVVKNAVNESWYNAPIGAPNGGTYGKLILSAGLKIPVKLYSFKIWAKDGKTSDPLGPHVRNRFYTGIDNYLSFDNILNVGIILENRLQAKSALSPKFPGNNPLDVSSDIEDRFSIAVDLNGSYDFGLSWGVTEAFRFHFLPGNDTSKQFDKVQFDGIYFIGFEFMHFTKAENITGQAYIELDLAVDYYPNDQVKGTKIYWLEYYLGFNFNIYGFTPSLGFDMTYDNMDPISNGYLFTGIKAGMGYAKDIYSVNITYVGNTTTNPDYYKTYYSSSSPVWENHIEAVFGISL
jgi:hypothetical protein